MGPGITPPLVELMAELMNWKAYYTLVLKAEHKSEAEQIADTDTDDEEEKKWNS